MENPTTQNFETTPRNLAYTLSFAEQKLGFVLDFLNRCGEGLIHPYTHSAFLSLLSEAQEAVLDTLEMIVQPGKKPPGEEAEMPGELKEALEAVEQEREKAGDHAAE